MSNKENKNNFLRPVFTKNIIEHLKKGKSLNVYGEKGTGKTRLLEDIEAAESENVMVIYASFKEYRQYCKGFLENLAKKLGIEDGIIKTFKNFVDSTEKKAASLNKNVFLFLDDIDTINGSKGIDNNYDEGFINTINFIKNNTKISLLITSVEPISTFLLFIEKRTITSFLDLEKWEISCLSQEEIENELKRRLENIESDEIKMIASFLVKFYASYDLLEYCEKKFKTDQDSNISINKRLKLWRKKFIKENKISWLKRFYNWSKGVKGFNKIIGKPANLFFNFIKGFIGFISNIIK